MQWKGRKPSKNIEDRRSPDDKAWSAMAPLDSVKNPTPAGAKKNFSDTVQRGKLAKPRLPGKSGW